RSAFGLWLARFAMSCGTQRAARELSLGTLQGAVRRARPEPPRAAMAVATGSAARAGATGVALCRAGVVGSRKNRLRLAKRPAATSRPAQSTVFTVLGTVSSATANSPGYTLRRSIAAALRLDAAADRRECR